ncbi:MAG: amino acid ABC transporter permease [Faecalicoccus sp.]|nr:amino acid ABC transporter permease [Faecalicoccus sp.]
MSAGRMTMQEALYERPGPKTKKKIAIFTIITIILIAILLGVVIYQFYINGQLDKKYWYFFLRLSTWKFLGKGLIGTIEAAVLAGVMTFILGFLYMLARISPYKILNWIGTALVEFTRGVPTLLFVYFFFLVAPQFGINLPSILRISLPVAISASGIVAEVLRTGINAIPKGQREAALSLGLTNAKVFLKIVFPQAFRYVIPSLISEMVIVVKDTTFAYVVNFPDLLQNARVFISNYDAMLSVYLFVAIIYILINYALNKLAVYVNERNKAGIKERRG